MKKHPQHRQLVNSNQAQAPIATFNRKAISLYVAMMFASNAAHANPTGGEFAAGAGAISAVGNLTTIQQASDRAIVNWQSFGSNAGETIKFIQPSADAAILNRVVGNLPSNLNGLLEGTGRVYLINPNGIVVGANGVINVNGGFVASTKSISDSAFMGGGALVFAGESTGSIQILGKVQSSQGDIILIAPKTEIMQSAVLEAGKSIKLVAANEVELSNGKITVKPKATDAGQITVEGALKAAQVQLEAHNNNLGALAINTTGTIRATGTQTNPDGSVTIMAYGEGSNIKVRGTVEAKNYDSTKQGGRIIVGRNEETGKLAKSADVSGARFVTNKGFVETSGHFLNVDGAQVIAKDWLLDPDNIDITNGTATAGYSSISASTLSNALTSGTTITVNTTAGIGTQAVTGTSASGSTGKILVTDAIGKTSAGDATLKLIADDSITLKNSITSSGKGAGKLNVNLSAGKTTTTGGVEINSGIQTNGGALSVTTKQGTIRQSTSINSSSTYGDVTYKTQGGQIFLNAGSTLYGQNIVLDGTGSADNVNFGNGAYANSASVYIYNANVIATGNLTILGNSSNGMGVQIQNNSLSGTNAKLSASTVTIKGVGTDRGVLMYNKSSIISTSGDINITGSGGSSAQDINILDTSSLNAGAKNIILTAESKDISLNTSSIVKGIVVANINNFTSNGLSLKSTTGAVSIDSAVDFTSTGSGTYKPTTLSLESASNKTITQAQNASIKVSKLELLGGSVTLNNTSNSVGTLAANVKSLQLTNQRDLTIDSVNSATGLTAAGNITINSTTTQKTGILINQNQNITAGGDVSLTGSTSEINQEPFMVNGTTYYVPYAGIKSYATVKGVNVTMTANATGGGTDVKALGYYGAGANGKFIATGNLTLNASSANSSNGFYMFAGELKGNQITINGTSTSGQAVGFDYKATVSSNSSLTINGTASDGKQAIGLHGVSLTAKGDVNLTATKGDITVDSSNPWDSSHTPLTNQITQSNNASGHVTLTTTGNGNITVPIIVNNSSGNVIVAAGSNLYAGNGDGGQVLTVLGNTITNNNGKTYIYSGNANHTGSLSNLGGFGQDLYLSTIGANTKNAASNTAYESNNVRNTIADGANTQVMFREKIALSGSLNDATITYGGSTSSAFVKAALQTANPADSTNTLSTNSSAGNLKILKADIINDFANGKPSMDAALSNANNKSSSGNLKASSTGYAIDMVGNNYDLRDVSAKLVVNPKAISIAAAGNTVYYNGRLQTDTVTNSGWVNRDKVAIVGAGSGTAERIYQSNLGLVGDDAGNYNVTPNNAAFTIKVNTPSAYRYNPSSADVVTLTPITFGLAYAGGATAAGGDVEGSCDAWSQRAGAGSVAVMTLLKTNYMGLRNAKTDSMEAMNGGQASGSSAASDDNPCANAAQLERQASL